MTRTESGEHGRECLILDFLFALALRSSIAKRNPHLMNTKESRLALKTLKSEPFSVFRRVHITIFPATGSQTMHRFGQGHPCQIVSDLVESWHS